MAIVRFDRARYEEKGKGGSGRGKRKPSIFSDKSHAKKFEGGRKLAVAFKQMNGDKPARKSMRKKRR